MTRHQRIVMVRHGESEWNLYNYFCGWYDARLSEKGLDDAYKIAKMLKSFGLEFDVVYTSLLERANQTLDIILEENGLRNIPVFRTWHLNERHYGALTGYNKRQMVERYGEEQVQIWRRSFDVPPPPMKEDHVHYNAIVYNPKWANELNPEDIPRTESLQSTMQRVLPYWSNVIAPQLQAGMRVLVVAHGTSLRGLVKHISRMSDSEITKLNLPNGIPFYYDLDEGLNPVSPLKFLADDETVQREMKKVASIDMCGPQSIIMTAEMPLFDGHNAMVPDFAIREILNAIIFNSVRDKKLCTEANL